MKAHTIYLAAVAALALLLAGPSLSLAQGPEHPSYLHALSDLRLMRSYLDRMTPNENMDEESQRAISEIDAAMRAIREASIDDHKDLRDHAPIDARIDRVGRFRKAREAGNAAWADVNHEEDNDYARGLKHRALDHIEAANHIVDHLIHRFESH